MNIYLELPLISAVVVYIVDLSGWTRTWLGWLSKFTARFHYPPVTELRPFSCSLCMVWWCGLAWALYRGQFTLPVVAYAAALSFLSITIREVFIFIREALTKGLANVEKWLQD